MKASRTFLSVVLMGASIATTAHEGEDHSRTTTGATKKAQQEWGIAGDAKDVKRTIRVRMDDDMRCTPDKLEVKQGDTVKFVMKNTGKLTHEFVIGTSKELDAHAIGTAKHPGMEHDEPYMVHVAAGQTGDLIWSFNRTGSFAFACLIAGHYPSSMVGKINVVPAGTDAPLRGTRHGTYQH